MRKKELERLLEKAVADALGLDLKQPETPHDETAVRGRSEGREAGAPHQQAAA